MTKIGICKRDTASNEAMPRTHAQALARAKESAVIKDFNDDTAMGIMEVVISYCATRTENTNPRLHTKNTGIRTALYNAGDVLYVLQWCEVDRKTRAKNEVEEADFFA